MFKQRFFIAILLPFFSISCASTNVQMMNGSNSSFRGSCNVKVYQTYNSASRDGIVKELCRVSGSSSMSFDHSVEGAIKKISPQLCQCGATHAYITSQHTEEQWGVKGLSHVSLVGFVFEE